MNKETFIEKLNTNCEYKNRFRKWTIEDVGPRYYCYQDECGHECCRTCQEIFDEQRKQTLLSYLLSKRIRLCSSCFRDFFHKSKSDYYYNLSLTLFDHKNLWKELKNLDFCIPCLVRFESSLIHYRLDRIERKLNIKTKIK